MEIFLKGVISRDRRAAGLISDSIRIRGVLSHNAVLVNPGTNDISFHGAAAFSFESELVRVSDISSTQTYGISFSAAVAAFSLSDAIELSPAVSFGVSTGAGLYAIGEIEPELSGAFALGADLGVVSDLGAAFASKVAVASEVTVVTDVPADFISGVNVSAGITVIDPSQTVFDLNPEFVTGVSMASQTEGVGELSVSFAAGVNTSVGLEAVSMVSAGFESTVVFGTSVDNVGDLAAAFVSGVGTTVETEVIGEIMANKQVGVDLSVELTGISDLSPALGIGVDVSAAVEAISVSEARAFDIDPAVDGKSTWDLDTDGPLTLGAGTWTITPHDQFAATLELWGPGGSSGGAEDGDDDASPGVDTVFSGLTAGAGGETLGAENNTPTSGGSGGIALGGDTNTNGNAGGTGSTDGPTTGGDGAAAPNGGVLVSGPTASGNNETIDGIDGNPPAGGASGGCRHTNNQNLRRSTGGGGSGAYVSKAYAVNDLAPGTPVTLTVGDGGDPGVGNRFSGGKGAEGRAVFS